MNRRELRQKRREYLEMSRKAGLVVVEVNSPKRWLRDVRDDFTEFGYKLTRSRKDPNKHKWVFYQGLPHEHEMKLSEARPHFAPDAGTTYIKKHKATKFIALSVRVGGVFPDFEGWSNITFFVDDPNEGRLCGNMLTPYPQEDIIHHINKDIFIVGKLAPWLAYTTISKDRIIPLVGLVVSNIKNEADAKAAWASFPQKGLNKIEQIVNDSKVVAARHKFD